MTYPIDRLLVRRATRAARPVIFLSLIAAVCLGIVFSSPDPAYGKSKKPAKLPILRPAGSDPADGDQRPEVQITLFNTARLTLLYLDRATRKEYMKTVVGQDADPFSPADPLEPDGFMVFLLTVENHGKDPLIVHPSFAILSYGKSGSYVGALESTLLEDMFASLPVFNQKLIARIHPSTISVNPDSQHAKLLIFPALPRKAKRAAVVIPSVSIGDHNSDATFPFEITWVPGPGL